MYLYAPILKFQGRSWGRGGGGVTTGAMCQGPAWTLLNAVKKRNSVP